VRNHPGGQLAEDHGSSKFTVTRAQYVYLQNFASVQ
jgi:hypothetical protein